MDPDLVPTNPFNTPSRLSIQSREDIKRGIIVGASLASIPEKQHIARIKETRRVGNIKSLADCKIILDELVQEGNAPQHIEDRTREVDTLKEKLTTAEHTIHHLRATVTSLREDSRNQFEERNKRSKLLQLVEDLLESNASRQDVIAIYHSARSIAGI